MQKIFLADSGETYALDLECFGSSTTTREGGRVKSCGRRGNSERAFTAESSLGMYKEKNWWTYGGGLEVDKHTARVGWSANVPSYPAQAELKSVTWHKV